MSHRFSLLVAWLMLHRSQIQTLTITIILVFALLSLAVPQMRMLAEEMPGGGH
jgi:hypothetical protein